MNNFSCALGVMICLLFLSCRSTTDALTFTAPSSTLTSCPIVSTWPKVRMGRPKPLAAPRRTADMFVLPRPQNLPKAYSQETTLFGVEIEFPIKGNHQGLAFSRFKEQIKSKCDRCPGTCTSFENFQTGRGSYLIYDQDKSPSYLSILVSTDPGVIEVSTAPLTYSQTVAWQPVLEEMIFETGRSLEREGILLSADQERNRWSGHINVSWPGLVAARSTTDVESMNLLLNFFVDMQNIPELSMGVLGGDTRNAPPLAFGSSEDHNKLRRIISDYQQGYLPNLTDLGTRLYRETYPSAFLGHYGSSFIPNPRYTLVNLENLMSEDAVWGYARGTRIELRGFFSPLSADAMLSNFRIINARLHHLHRRLSHRERKVLDFSPPTFDARLLQVMTIENHKTEGLIGNLSPDAAAAAYIKFLMEAGLDPRDEIKFIRDPLVRKAVEVRMRCHRVRV